ncbi:MAG: acetylornithine/succinylornithine family transaminase [Actinomycetota bacterium]|nr:acetylornithine/succinylornithine family transaminase [Actinomycetota bacterium]
MTGQKLAPTAPSAVMPTYRRYPVTLVRGEGMHVFDSDGGRYLDFAGALGAIPLGHGHPAWRAAVHEQVDRLGLVSNLYATEPQVHLAERLAAISGIPEAQVFFSNSGAEANEAALKLVRKWGLGRGRTKIVALDGSFHGRTVATLAATGQRAKRVAFEPLVDWFTHVAPQDIDALDTAVTDETAAVLLEPVLGEGGVLPLSKEYLRAAREITSARGALLVADEVQSGLGRCGDWLAISFAGVTPDVISLAKGLGGGLPIGATISSAEIAFAPGDHASTFGGGPIPCAAGLAVLDTIEKEDLLQNAREQGDRLRQRLASSGAKEVRGRGLLTGIELRGAVAHDVVLDMLERGVLATEAGDAVVRMSPALIVETQQVDEAAEAFAKSLLAVGGTS